MSLEEHNKYDEEEELEDIESFSDVEDVEDADLDVAELEAKKNKKNSSDNKPRCMQDDEDLMAMTNAKHSYLDGKVLSYVENAPKAFNHRLPSYLGPFVRVDDDEIDDKEAQRNAKKARLQFDDGYALSEFFRAKHFREYTGINYAKTQASSKMTYDEPSCTRANNVLFSEVCKALEAIRLARRVDHKIAALTQICKHVNGKNAAENMYPVLRLIIPQYDRERPRYFAKELTMSKIYVKMMAFGPGTIDEERVMKYDCPGLGEKTKVNCGSLPSVIRGIMEVRGILNEEGFKHDRNKRLTCGEINAILNRLHDAEDIDAKANVAQDVFFRMSSLEHYWFVRIVLRMTIPVRLARRDLLMIMPGTDRGLSFWGDLRRVSAVNCIASSQGKVPNFGIELFSPFRPMLSNRTRIDLATKGLGDFLIEEKLDGERMMIHMCSETRRVEFFTRHQQIYTKRYCAPVLKEAILRTFRRCKQCILDGEILSYDSHVGDLSRDANFLNVEAAEEMFKLHDKASRWLRYFCFDVLYVEYADGQGDGGGAVGARAEDDALADAAEACPDGDGAAGARADDDALAATVTCPDGDCAAGARADDDALAATVTCPDGDGAAGARPTGDLTMFPLWARLKVLDYIYCPTGTGSKYVSKVEAMAVIKNQENLDERHKIVMRSLDAIIRSNREGLVLKSFNAPYSIASRSTLWVKVKPDYVGNLSEGVDLIVLGGLSAEGEERMSENELHVTRLLFGVRVGAAHETAKYEIFCQTGIGITNDDLDIIRLYFEKCGKLIREETPRHFQAPKGCVAWLLPKDSFLVEVSGTQAQQNQARFRFPWVRRIRVDLDISSCFTREQVEDRFRRGFYLANKTPIVEIERTALHGKPKQKHLTVWREVGLLKALVNHNFEKDFLDKALRATTRCWTSHSQDSDVKGERVFRDQKFAVWKGAYKDFDLNSERAVKAFICLHGGLVLDNHLPNVQFHVAVDMHNAPLRLLNYTEKSLNSIQVVSLDFLLACVCQKRLLEPRSHHLLFLGSKRVSELSNLKVGNGFDQFGDSYCVPSDFNSLDRSMNKVRVLRAEIAENALSLLGQDEDDLMFTPDQCMRGALVFFTQDVDAMDVGVAKIQIRMAGGEICSELDATCMPTHVIVVSGNCDSKKTRDDIARLRCGAMRRELQSWREPQVLTLPWVVAAIEYSGENNAPWERCPWEKFAWRQ